MVEGEEVAAISPPEIAEADQGQMDIEEQQQQQEDSDEAPSVPEELVRTPAVSESESEPEQQREELMCLVISQPSPASVEADEIVAMEVTEAHRRRSGSSGGKRQSVCSDGMSETTVKASRLDISDGAGPSQGSVSFEQFMDGLGGGNQINPPLSIVISDSGHGSPGSSATMSTGTLSADVSGPSPLINADLGGSLPPSDIVLGGSLPPSDVVLGGPQPPIELVVGGPLPPSSIVVDGNLPSISSIMSDASVQNIVTGLMEVVSQAIDEAQGDNVLIVGDTHPPRSVMSVSSMGGSLPPMLVVTISGQEPPSLVSSYAAQAAPSYQPQVQASGYTVCCAK